MNVLDLNVDEWEARKEAGLPEIPAKQTPWQEIAPNTVGQLADGAAIEYTLTYHEVGRTVPRHNH